MSQRTERIDELLRQEIGQALEGELADPALGFVTVTDVETSPDLAHARVWVSVIGSDEQRKASLAALRRAMPYIRHGLGAKIRLRRIPELDVRLDDSVERGTRVLHLIDELAAGRTPDELPGSGETLPTPVKRLPREGDSPEIAPADPVEAAPPRDRKSSPDSTGRSKGSARKGPDGKRSSRRTQR